MHSLPLALAAALLAGALQQSLPDAVVDGRAPAVEALIKGGADVNAPDENGLSPLALAAMQGQTAIARLLIDARAAVNQASSDGTTPLMRAASANHSETVRLLIASGADVNARNNQGRTPVDAGLSLDPTFTIRRYREGQLSDNHVFFAARERMRKAGAPER